MNKLFSSVNNKKKFLIVLLILLIFSILIYYFSLPLFHLFKNPDNVKDFVLSFGVFSPIALILLQILQVLIASIPGQIAGLVSGYIYGTIFGTILTMIGTVIGSLIIFVLVRKFGRPFVEKVVNKKIIKKFDYISKEKGIFALFLIFLLPGLPDDAVCFIAGLTKIPIKKLIIITFIGRLPGFIILNMLGAGMANMETGLFVGICSILVVASGIIYLLNEKIENFFMRIYWRLKTKNI